MYIIIIGDFKVTVAIDVADDVIHTLYVTRKLKGAVYHTVCHGITLFGAAHPIHRAHNRCGETIRGHLWRIDVNRMLWRRGVASSRCAAPVGSIHSVAIGCNGVFITGESIGKHLQNQLFTRATTRDQCVPATIKGPGRGIGAGVEEPLRRPYPAKAGRGARHINIPIVGIALIAQNIQSICTVFIKMGAGV